MSMNKTWAISSWISFLISADILSAALRLTMPFLLWHFSPGDKIENCSAQFLAVCWIVHVDFKLHRLRDGFSVSGGERMGLCAGRRMGGIWYDLHCWGAVLCSERHASRSAHRAHGSDQPHNL